MFNIPLKYYVFLTVSSVVNISDQILHTELPVLKHCSIRLLRVRPHKNRGTHLKLINLIPPVDTMIIDSDTTSKNTVPRSYKIFLTLSVMKEW